MGIERLHGYIRNGTGDGLFYLPSGTSFLLLSLEPSIGRSRTLVATQSGMAFGYRDPALSDYLTLLYCTVPMVSRDSDKYRKSQLSKLETPDWCRTEQAPSKVMTRAYCKMYSLG